MDNGEWRIGMWGFWSAGVLECGSFGVRGFCRRGGLLFRQDLVYKV